MKKQVGMTAVDLLRAKIQPLADELNGLERSDRLAKGKALKGGHFRSDSGPRERSYFRVDRVVDTVCYGPYLFLMKSGLAQINPRETWSAHYDELSGAGWHRISRAEFDRVLDRVSKRIAGLKASRPR